jgi:glycosyl transferase family 25
MIKKIFFILFVGWLSILVYPINYFIFLTKQDVSLYENNKRTFKGVGVYLINLDRSKDRYDYVIDKIKALGLPFKRISAVDGNLLSADELEKMVDKSWLEYKKGQIGCYLSHVKFWKEFLESDYEYAVVFEDDVTFDPLKLKETIDEVLKYPSYWDICTFNMHWGNGDQHFALSVDKILNQYEMLYYLQKPYLTGCYLINRHAAINLLQKAFPIKDAVDQYFSRSWEFDLKFVGIEPQLVSQSFGDSNIGASEEFKTGNKLTFYKKLKLEIGRIQEQHICLFYNLKLWFQNKRFF